jgi:hypothetical protein
MTQAAVSTPLGHLRVTGDEATGWFAQGYSLYDRETLFSIKMPDPHHPDIDFSFISHQLSQLPHRCRQATDYLARHFPNEAALSEGNLAWGAEVTFWQDRNWSILFTEGRLPICHPYGILVNFDDSFVTGFDDLSNAEEL